jgi:hypothetical protein
VRAPVHAVIAVRSRSRRSRSKDSTGRCQSRHMHHRAMRDGIDTCRDTGSAIRPRRTISATVFLLSPTSRPTRR